KAATAFAVWYKRNSAVSTRSDSRHTTRDPRGHGGTEVTQNRMCRGRLSPPYRSTSSHRLSQNRQPRERREPAAELIDEARTLPEPPQRNSKRQTCTVQQRSGGDEAQAVSEPGDAERHLAAMGVTMEHGEHRDRGGRDRNRRADAERHRGAEQDHG